MATTQSITSTYSGRNAGEYIAPAIQAADTLAKGIVSFLPNIKYKTTLNKFESANGTVDFACDFTPAGSVTLTEKVLAPKKLMVNLELCKENFIASWEAESMGFGANNENLPTEFNQYFIGQVLAEQSFKIDQDIWTGSGSLDGEFEGFLTQWAADGNIVKISTPVAITAANVISKLEAVYDAIPDSIINKPDLKIVVSNNVARAYRRALSTLGFRNDYTVGEKPLDFEGLDLEVVNGLPASTIAAFQTKNLYFGTGLLSDHQEVSTLDMYDKDLSDNVRFKMVYTGGTQYVISEEIVLYAV